MASQVEVTLNLFWALCTVLYGLYFHMICGDVQSVCEHVFAQLTTLILIPVLDYGVLLENIGLKKKKEKEKTCQPMATQQLNSEQHSK